MSLVRRLTAAIVAVLIAGAGAGGAAPPPPPRSRPTDPCARRRAPGSTRWRCRPGCRSSRTPVASGSSRGSARGRRAGPGHWGPRRQGRRPRRTRGSAPGASPRCSPACSRCSWSTGAGGRSTPRSATCCPGSGRRAPEVTLRQLLSHTSGMPDYLGALIAGAKTLRQFQRVISQRRTDHELVRAAKRQPWEFRPGTSFGYSNTNFVTVGLMLERAAGTPVSRLMERRIFRPAGMTQSALTRSPRIRPPELVETGVLGKKLRDLSGTEPSLFSAAGALVTTTADLDRFQAALSSGLLVSRSRLHAMRANVAVQPNGLELRARQLPAARPVRQGPLRLRSRRGDVRHPDDDVRAAEGTHAGDRGDERPRPRRREGEAGGGDGDATCSTRSRRPVAT